MVLGLYALGPEQYHFAELVDAPQPECTLNIIFAMLGLIIASGYKVSIKFSRLKKGSAFGSEGRRCVMQKRAEHRSSDKEETIAEYASSLKIFITSVQYRFFLITRLHETHMIKVQPEVKGPKRRGKLKGTKRTQLDRRGEWRSRFSTN